MTDLSNPKSAEPDVLYNNLINKIRQLEDVNHIMAHNIRGVASNIKMIADSLIENETEENEKAKGDFSTHEAIHYIQESSSSLINSLGTLMEVVDIVINEKIHYDECDVQKIVENIIQQLHGIIHHKEAVIELQLEVKYVSYPLVYLESILYNLVSNALKYSRPGIPARILISTYQQHEKIVLAVKDNGLGIDLKKFGNKIFQLNQVFHPGHDSKGIGLFITKAQIESLGGNISVKSTVNEGSEFMATL